MAKKRKRTKKTEEDVVTLKEFVEMGEPAEKMQALAESMGHTLNSGEVPQPTEPSPNGDAPVAPVKVRRPRRDADGWEGTGPFECQEHKYRWTIKRYYDKHMATAHGVMEGAA